MFRIIIFNFLILLSGGFGIQLGAAGVVVCQGNHDGEQAKVIKLGYHPTADCQLWIRDDYYGGWMMASDRVDCRMACASIGASYEDGGSGGGDSSESGWWTKFWEWVRSDFLMGF